MRKNVVVGVCGGISSYKTAELVRLLVKTGFSVKVIMTEAAVKFVTPLVFQTLSKNHVYIDMFNLYGENTQHIALADWADLCILAPLSANTLSKMAYGICDNLLTTVICALPKSIKVLSAPAMNENMWNNPIVKENIGKLKSKKKYLFLAPIKGELACGAYGEGRMAEAKDIFKHIESLFKK